MIDCGTYRFDRCDRCGAKGRHKGERNGLDLILCNHHFSQIGPAMLHRGWIFTDLEEKVSA